MTEAENRKWKRQQEKALKEITRRAFDIFKPPRRRRMNRHTARS